LASHLTVSSNAAAGVPAPRPLNNQPSEKPDAFAALLGASSTKSDAPEVQPPPAENSDTASSDQQAQGNPDPVAAALNATLPFETPAPVEAKPLLEDVLASLSDLKIKLENGEPLDPELLAKLNAQLDSLGEALGIDLANMPGLEELAALVSAPVPDTASPPDKLAGSLAPLADKLLTGAANAPADTAALQRSVGEKLAALLGSINNGELDTGKLAELGLADAELDPEIEAAIAKLLVSPPKVEVATPILAKPTLQLDEPVLTGKAQAEPAAKVELAPSELAAIEKPASEQKSDPGTSGERKDDSKPTDAKPAPIAANSNEPKPETPFPAPQPQQQARADAVAAPRVVQVGYQTSQQQLNLPQIAFELARQTTDGNTRFQIRLDPAELGRIDVQLDIDKSGQVNARLIVEKAETLDLMQRDQRGLEKALHQAGLDSSKTNLEFSLKQNNGGDAQQQGRPWQAGNAQNGNGAETSEPPPTINLYRASLSASGVNIIA